MILSLLLKVMLSMFETLDQCDVRLQRLSYAKGESDAVAKVKGTFVEKDKKERQKHNKIERGASLLS